MIVLCQSLVAVVVAGFEFTFEPWSVTDVDFVISFCLAAWRTWSFWQRAEEQR